MNIVGFGGAGCAFVSQLEKHNQYNIYKIDKGLPRKGNTYLPHQRTILSRRVRKEPSEAKPVHLKNG